MIYNNILGLIGNTPIVKLNRLYPSDYEVYLKLERQNPGGSIKDRIALAMIEEAEANGIIDKDTVIIEPTSGNTGIALSMIGAVKGYRVIITMPESMSIERRKIMQAYGAEVILTPREKGMKGAIEKANELHQEIKNSWIPQQFENHANVEAHIKTTAQEILKDLPDGVDYLITGVGTGGHITGVARVLKEQFPDLKVFAVEPELSPVLSGGEPSPHPLQGIGAGFIPIILQKDLLDGVITVSKDEAFDYMKKIAKTEGIFVGISTGASLAAIAKKLNSIPKNSRILTFNYDTGERYISNEELF